MIQSEKLKPRKKTSAKELAQDKIARLTALYEQYSQTKHPFSNFNLNKIVPGTGNVNSPLLFLGEGPGRDEDIQGVPFVGRAGQLLDKIINAMGFERKDLYITNVVKCRLPNNRPPTDDEIAIEKRLILDRELSILQPQIICTLGVSATKAMLGAKTKISVVRGNFFEILFVHATISRMALASGNCLKTHKLVVMPTYHPAYLLRNPAAKTIVWADMEKILAKLSQR